MNNNFEHPTIPQNDTWESPPHHSINQSAAATSLTDHDALTFNLFIYVLPLMIVVGSVANFLVFLVMRRPKMRHQTTGFYMAILAIADELALLCGCLNKWLWEFNKVTILHMSPAACKIFSSIFYTTMDFSVWMVVIMTVERFIAVTFPLKAAYFCTIKKAKYATLATLVVTFAVNAHFLVTHTFIYRNNEHGCQSKSETFDEFMHFMWPWIDASKYSFIPVITIFIFNILIIYNLVQASDSRSKLISGDSSANKLRQANASAPQYTSASTAASSTPQSSNNNRRLTTMLLVVSITFCILSTPLLVLQILEQAKIVQRTVVLLRINAVCLFLQYSNHTVNFFLYAVTGKIFRRELVGLFCSCKSVVGKQMRWRKGAAGKDSIMNRSNAMASKKAAMLQKVSDWNRQQQQQQRNAADRFKNSQMRLEKDVNSTSANVGETSSSAYNGNGQTNDMSMSNLNSLVPKESVV